MTAEYCELSRRHGSADYTESAERRTRISEEGHLMKTLVLTRSEVEQVTTMELAVTAVEGAFAGFGRGEASMPPKVYLPIEDHDGDFRAMPARLGDSAGIKWVNVHAHNRKRYGLPTVMAVYVLNDPANAFPLAVMDGTLLTALRTGAAGAIASKHLAQGRRRRSASSGAERRPTRSMVHTRSYSTGSRASRTTETMPPRVALQSGWARAW